jgi:isoleucyl-tRNA synthetase
MAGARSGSWTLRDDGRVEVGGVVLEPDEFQLTARARPGHEVAEEGGLLVALDTTIDDELAAEGLAREVAHALQNLRKAAGYEVTDRIEVAIRADEATVARLEPHRSWLAGETLADRLELAPDAAIDAEREAPLELDGARLTLGLRRSAR